MSERKRVYYHHSSRREQSMPRVVYGWMKTKLINTWQGYLKDDCILDARQLQTISRHKYNSRDSSILDELCMKRFWSYLIEYFPLWIAPNLLTITGLLVNSATTLLLTFYSSIMEAPPFWVFILAALGLFVYQTLDALDGNQARRLKCASPLGELFDHGCDSLSQIYITLNVCHAMQLWRDSYGAVTVVIFSISLFYCAHWSTYCTGQLRFSRIDVTEAQDIIILLLLITAVFGPNIWSLTIFGFLLRHICLCVFFAGSIVQIFRYIELAITGGAGKNGSTVANSSVIFPVIPLIFVVYPFYYVYSRSATTFYDDNVTLFSLCLGAVGAKITNRVMIGTISKSEILLWDWIYLAPLLMMFNVSFGFIFDEKLILIIAIVYSYASLLIYCMVICKQLCAYLCIECFSVTSPN